MSELENYREDKKEIARLNAVLDRLADKDYMYRPNFTRQRGTDPNWMAECEARIDYALNRGET